MKRFISLILVCSIALVGCSQQQDLQPISGSFKVVPEESNINFTSIKNQDIGVSGFFDSVSGKITVPDNGNITKANGKISLGLTSLNTGLSVRDKRVLKHFFETEPDNPDAKNSSAVFSVKSLETEDINKLKELHDSVKVTAVGEMNLHGQTVKQAMELTVTRTGKNQVRATTRKPYVFNVKKFNMVKPLEKLMEVCGHGDLSMAVPITIDLTLREA
ncbi:MAG: YceI family protein [bacterium]